MVTTLKTARETILDLLIANLTDPEGRGDNTWIRGIGAGNQDTFVGYPLVSVGHTTQEAPTKAFNKNKIFRKGQIIIMVYTADDIQLDELADSIITVIETNEASLNTSGLYNVTVTVGEGDFLLEGGDSLHSLPLTVEYTI